MKSKSLILFIAGILLLYLCIGVASALPYDGVVDWQKTLGGSNYDYAYSILPTSDGGDIFAADSRSNDGDLTELTNNGLSDWWVVKQDTAGVTQWQYLLGGVKDDTPFSIKQTSDGGFIIAGTTDGGPYLGAPDVWVVKLDSAGSLQWEKKYGGLYWDIARDIQPTNDGGYIFIAETESNSTGDVGPNHGGETFTDDVWVVKLDSAGLIQWSKMFGGDKDDSGRHIWQTADNGYIFTAITKSNNNGDVGPNHDPTGATDDVWVVRLNSAGVMQWQKVLGGSAEDGFWGWEVQETKPDHGYILAGSTESSDGDLSTTIPLGNEDLWVVKLDTAGPITWQKRLGGSGDDWAMSCQQTTDGGYIVGGSTASSDGDVGPTWHGGTDAWVVKLDNAGSTQMSKVLGADSYDYLESIRQMNDGKFILAGETLSDNNGDVGPNHGLADVWIVKLHAVLTGSIRVESVPDGADVSIDNTPQMLKTNNTFAGFAPGIHTVRVMHAGYFDAQREVTVDSGKTVTTIIRMDAKPLPPVFDQKVIDAVDVVLDKELHYDTTGVTVSAVKSVFNAPPAVQLYWGRPTLTFNTNHCSLITIDYGPDANGERPITYICVDENNNIVDKQYTWAPATNYVFTFAAGESLHPGEIWVPHDPDAWEPACKENCDKYYAVLISGATDKNLNFVRYWNDIAFMYITLEEYGYLPSHITVLMSDGPDGGNDRCIATSGTQCIQNDNSPQNLDGIGGDEVIQKASYTNVKTELNRLRSTLTATDNLFIFTTGHGGGDVNSNSRIMLWGTDQITDSDFYAQLITGDTSIPSLTMVMEQCNGGGFNNEFITGTSKRILMSAADVNEQSYANGFSDAWTRGVAGHSRYATSADPKWDRTADGGDQRVTMLEAFTYATAKDSYAVSGAEHPKKYVTPSGSTGSDRYMDNCNSASPTVKVTYPTLPGYTWARGSFHEITWDVDAYTGNVNIYLVQGSTETTIQTNVPGYQGSIYYTVPDAQATGSSKIRVRGTGGSPTDDSDNAFTITTRPATYLGALAFSTSPAGASIYLDGSSSSSGTTPFTTPMNLAQGDHRVKVTLSKYYDRSYKVPVTAGQTYTCPTWPLELIPTSGTNADFSPWGGMDIRTDPVGADIWIHKIGDIAPAANQGSAPAVLDLSPGDYQVYVTKEGYQQSATQTVKVERSYPKRAPVVVDFTLTKIPDISAQVLIVPQPLNIGRTGYFLAFVRLPTGYKAADVNAGSVYCENKQALKLVRINLFPQIFAAVFSRQDLAVSTGNIKMTVRGTIRKNGATVPFSGSTNVNVINKKVTTREDVDGVMTMPDTQIFTKFNKF